MIYVCFVFFKAEAGIRDVAVTGVQPCALPISTVYDAAGNIVSVTTPGGNVITTKYDSRNRPIEVRDSLGIASATTYDAVGNPLTQTNRKSTRLNSSHGYISYAVFCLKKKKNSTHPNST